MTSDVTFSDKQLREVSLRLWQKLSSFNGFYAVSNDSQPVEHFVSVMSAFLRVLVSGDERDIDIDDGC